MMSFFRCGSQEDKRKLFKVNRPLFQQKIKLSDITSSLSNQ